MVLPGIPDCGRIVINRRQCLVSVCTEELNTVILRVIRNMQRALFNSKPAVCPFCPNIRTLHRVIVSSDNKAAASLKGKVRSPLVIFSV